MLAMREVARDKNGPTIFASQSAHKLLAALSQASMVHVRNGRIPIEQGRFNEGFMMQISTSPLYLIIASLVVASKMMEMVSVKILTPESIEEAIKVRRTMSRIKREIGTGKDKNDWGFPMWQPDTIIDPKTRKKTSFEEISLDTLLENPSCWTIRPGEIWYGSTGFPDNN